MEGQRPRPSIEMVGRPIGRVAARREAQIAEYYQVRVAREAVALSGLNGQATPETKERARRLKASARRAMAVPRGVGDIPTARVSRGSGENHSRQSTSRSGSIL